MTQLMTHHDPHPRPAFGVTRLALLIAGLVGALMLFGLSHYAPLTAPILRTAGVLWLVLCIIVRFSLDLMGEP